jgi:tetratricopeptide (TPR) repeat protein
MITSSLVAVARAHASSGAWAELRALLLAQKDEVAQSTELTNLLAESYLRTGDPRGASEVLSGAMQTLPRFGDRVALRRAVNLSGAAHFELGEIESAESAFERAIELAVQDGDDLLMARATHNLAVIANIRGRHADALARYRLAIPAYQRLGHVVAIAESHHNIARTYRDQGALDIADDHEQRAIEFGRQAMNLRVIASALVGRAEIALKRSDAAMAEVEAMRAARDFGRIPDPSRQADALRVCGVARAALGKREAAARSIEEALGIARSCGAALVEGECLFARAELSAGSGMLDSARDDARHALTIFTRLNAEADKVAVERWLATH